MKKHTKLILLLLLVTSIFLLSACYEEPIKTCQHQWIKADCLYPKTCRICYEIDGVALGHSFIDATCTEPKTCTKCGLTEGKALEHNYFAAVTPPTCTEKGYTTRTCRICNDIKIDTYVNATGHTEVIDKAVSATCTKKGLTEGKHCSVCNEILVTQDTISALGHKYESVKTPSTCKQNGYTTHTCSVCGDTKIEESLLGKTPHSFLYTTTSPTCTQGGYTTITCRNCDLHQVTNYTDPKGHTEVIDPAVEPTTTSTGLTEGSHCSVCHTVFIEQVVIPQKISPSETSTFQIKKNDILKTYSSLYDYNEYSIDYVEIDKKDTSDIEFQITVTIGAVMLLIPEDVDYVPNYIKGYWKLIKDGDTVDWDIFTISSVEELEYREVSFTCRNLEAGDYTLHFTSYI